MTTTDPPAPEEPRPPAPPGPAASGTPAAASSPPVVLPEPPAAVPTDTSGRPPRPGEGGPGLGEATRALGAALGREARRAGGGLAAGGAAWAGRLRREAQGAARDAGPAWAAARARLGSLGPARAAARPDPAPAADAPPPGEPPAPPRAPAPAPRPRRRPWPGSSRIRRGWRLALGVVLGLAVGAAAATAGIWLVVRDLPLADILPPLEEPSVSIRSADGSLLTTRGAYRASYVGLDGFPAALPEAVMAIEDRRFREHGGVDLRGITRALVRNVAAGGVVEGGSTLTQQLVKILYLEPDRTLTRKLQEVAIATTLERQLGKDRILELYLNSVYLGSGAYGMPAAARTYFGKDAADLTLEECAMLAASIQLPSQVNPIADLGAAQNRAALVLTLMAAQGRIDEAARDAAVARLATLLPDPPPERSGSYFADWVLAEAASLSGEAPTALTATATLDPALQAEAERIVADVIGREGAAAGAGQAALVAMTPSGEVRAMVGGVSYADSQFNRATDALRQPGSTFKLFVYLAALAGGATPDSRIEDTPVEIDGWSPENFDGQAHGAVTLREAFARSYNLAAVRLGQLVGIDNVVGVARLFGIATPLDATPSLALGTSGVSLIDMTEAYAAVQRGAAPVTATGLTAIRFGEDGPTLAVTGDGETEPVPLQRTRGPMRDLLAAVVQEGTGRTAAVEGVLGGKTGTSQDSRDAWFIGYTDSLVVGVWVGNDDNSPMDRVTGGGLPAEIFARVVEAARSGDAAGRPARERRDGSPRAGAAEAEGALPALADEAPVQCRIRACSRAYRSFRASDCTYQPFSGPRRLCTR